MPRATMVFLHGLGASNKMWQSTIKNLDKRIRTVSVDLIGFGRSVKPTWIDYTLDNQVKSLHWTLSKKGLFLTKEPLVLIGHSMGSLVAMKFAIRYPDVASQLVLISPPIYKDLEKQKSAYQTLLFKIYQAIGSDGKLLDNALSLIDGHFTWDYDDSKASLSAVQNSLEKSIMNDPLFEQALRLKTPTLIYFGKFDPLVPSDSLKEIDQFNPRVKIVEKLGAHTIKSLHFDLVKELNQLADNLANS